VNADEIGQHWRMISTDGSLVLSWTPRPAELADASLARNRDVGGSTSRAWMAIVLALLASPLLGTPSTLPMGVVLITLAFVLAWIRVTTPLMRRRWAVLAAGNPALVESVEATVDDAGVRTVGERMSVARRWSAFTSWSDTPEAVVLATSDTANGALLVVPHRVAAGPDEVAALRALVTRHLGPALGAGPGGPGRSWWPWVARAVVLACLVVPLTWTIARVHQESGEWGLRPSEAPPRVTRDGADYRRTGPSTTARPPGVTGSSYTPGGGLVLVTWPASSKPSELWVLDHANVVRHYVRTVASKP
jgi:hypothetical protein